MAVRVDPRARRARVRPRLLGSALGFPPGLPLAFLLASALGGAVACGGGGGPTGPPATIQGTPAWTARSAPLAMEYLRTLPEDRVGNALAGIPLSDGGRWLEGFVYYGRVEVDHPGMHVHVLATPEGEALSLAWVDAEGEPWPLPDCESGQVRARALGGQVYTWKSLRPGDGIVRPGCPPAEWLERVPPPPPPPEEA